MTERRRRAVDVVDEDVECGGPKYDLGVVLVHGIGRQGRGATLRQWCDAIVEWSDVCTRLGPIDAVAVEADPSGSGGPPNAALRVSVDGVQRTWLVAESFWAESIAPPTFVELARWTFQVVPWTLAAHAIRATRRADERRHALSGVGEESLRDRLRYGCMRVALTARAAVWRVVVVLLGVVSAPLVLTLLALVLLLGAVPTARSRAAARALQRSLAATIGDSLVLIESSVQAAAVTSVFRRTLQWVSDQRCSRIVVIAHSQGAAVALEALSTGSVIGSRGGRTRTPDVDVASPPVDALVTLGSGVNKLSGLVDRRHLPQRWFGWVTSSAALLAAAIAVGIVREVVVGGLEPGVVATQLALVAAFGPYVVHLLADLRLARERHPRPTQVELAGLLDLCVIGNGPPRSRLSERDLRRRRFEVLRRDDPTDAETIRANGRTLIVVVALGYAIRLASLGVLVFAAYLNDPVVLEPLWDASPALLLGVVLLVCAATAAWRLSVNLPHDVGPPRPPQVGRWLDLHASADPVPNGPTAPPTRRTAIRTGSLWASARRFLAVLLVTGWPRPSDPEGREVRDLLQQVQTSGSVRARRRLMRLLAPVLVVHRSRRPGPPDDVVSSSDRGGSVSVEVPNEGSVLRDHVRYHRSDDGAMLRLMALLCEVADTPLRVVQTTKHTERLTPDRIDRIGRDRAHRVAVLIAIRTMVAVLTITTVVGLRGRYDAIGTMVLEHYGSIVDWLPTWLTGALAVDPTGGGAVVAGTALPLVAGVVLAWLARLAWGSWDRRAVSRAL